MGRPRQVCVISGIPESVGWISDDSWPGSKIIMSAANSSQQQQIGTTYGSHEQYNTFKTKDNNIVGAYKVLKLPIPRCRMACNQMPAKNLAQRSSKKTPSTTAISRLLLGLGFRVCRPCSVADSDLFACSTNLNVAHMIFQLLSSMK